MMSGTKNIFLLLSIILEIAAFCYSFPLSTSSQWIVDQGTKKRVKLACVNWASHLQPMIAEGLEKKPLNFIASQIAADGFNCVRFTWATFMFTRPDYFNLTVTQSLDKYNLAAAKLGVQKNNPLIVNMTIKEVHMVVVNELGKNNLMVLLDNHLSEPEWCCNETDGNGFFGDSSFNSTEWLKGLTEVTRTYKNNIAVVGMSLRNELRGKRQNVKEWRVYMKQGANAVHRENPNVLVIISGLNYARSLSFLKKSPLNLLNLKNKLVYEAHRYGYGNPEDRFWINQTNKACAGLNKSSWQNYLFLTAGKSPFPLLLSEFGTDQSGRDEAGNRYMTCLTAVLAETDIDWALWTFQGSYMLREGIVDYQESYGVMDFNWNGPTNPDFLKRLQFVSRASQDPSSKKKTYYTMFHPQSGECVRVDKNNSVFLDKCENASQWDRHVNGDVINLKRSERCLEVAGVGAVVRVVREFCWSTWKFVSSSGLQLAAQVEGQGEYLCLERNTSDSRLVTNKCLCVGKNLVDLPTCATNPQVQWFKFVPTNV